MHMLGESRAGNEAAAATQFAIAIVEWWLRLLGVGHDKNLGIRRSTQFSKGCLWTNGRNW